MNPYEILVPNLATAYKGPSGPLERVILNQIARIETWFLQKWQDTPPALTASVDLRHAGFKLAPVDTNLFPAGFNNINPEFLSLCVRAAQTVLAEYLPGCNRLLILPELHTRNQFYLESIRVLHTIFSQAGFIVRIGSLDPGLTESVLQPLDSGPPLLLEPLRRNGNTIELIDFIPDFILLNNDLSSGIPDLLQGITQKIMPTAQLGWSSRLKSHHFQFFDAVAKEFSELVGLDPWLINPYFSALDGLDFMAQEGLEHLADEVDTMLALIRAQYAAYDINEIPFVAIKADNGTYGMSVMMAQNGDEIRHLNRKRRTKMSSSKGSRKVDRVLIQEGVYTIETMPNGAVAEPVIYMIGEFVVGGFYRVHQEKGVTDNLNAPGMHFEPLAFSEPGIDLSDKATNEAYPNRFYVYSVIARLAALAAAREIAAIGEQH